MKHRKSGGKNNACACTPCMHAHTYIYIYIYIHMHVHAQRMQNHARMHACMKDHAFACKIADRNRHAFIRMHASVWMRSLACMHAYTECLCMRMEDCMRAMHANRMDACEKSHRRMQRDARAHACMHASVSAVYCFLGSLFEISSCNSKPCETNPAAGGSHSAVHPPLQQQQEQHEQQR